MENNSLTLLSESLDQKISVLQDIQAYNQKQEKALTEQTPDLDSFDKALEEKEELIQRVEKLDEGFETLYAQVKEELNKNRAVHAGRIQELQEKIRRITDMSVAIQAEEARNKKLIEEYFAKAKAGIRQGRQSSKAAYDYYRNMSGANFISPQYMDSKN